MTTTASSNSTFAGRSIVLLQSLPESSPSDIKRPVPQRHRVPVVTAAEFSPAEGLRWFGIAGEGLVPVDDPDQAVFAARVVRRNFGIALGVLAEADGLLGNGIPALRFFVLDVKSTLVVPGLDAFFYISEMVRPFAGLAPAEIIGKECPICKIPFDSKTQVGMCRCGQFYHNETAQSHPRVPEKDRLPCFTDARRCHCGTPLTTEEQLTWSPES